MQAIDYRGRYPLAIPTSEVIAMEFALPPQVAVQRKANGKYEVMIQWREASPDGPGGGAYYVDTGDSMTLEFMEQHLTDLYRVQSPLLESQIAEVFTVLRRQRDDARRATCDSTPGNQDTIARLQAQLHGARSSLHAANESNNRLHAALHEAERRAKEMDAAAADVIASSPLRSDSGLGIVHAECLRVRLQERHTVARDDRYMDGQLALAAASYAAGSKLPSWPWTDKWWRPGNRIRELAKAGQLIVAEIERLLRRDTESPCKDST